MKFEEELNKFTKEQISQIPKKICEILIVDFEEYKNQENRNEIDDKIIKFKKSNEYIGFYNTDILRLYVKSTWSKKTMVERRIIEFLKDGKWKGI